MTAPFRLKYICIGPPHSGTGYVARLMTSFGIVCGHEHIFHQRWVLDNWSGIGPWGYLWSEVQAESAWPAHRHLDHEMLVGVHILHVLRNPLHVIESLWKKRGEGGGTIQRLCECLKLYREITEDILWAQDRYPGKFKGYSTYRVESGPQGMAELLELPVPDEVFDDREYNSHMHGAPRELTSWDKVSERVIGDLAWFRENSNRFGYGVS